MNKAKGSNRPGFRLFSIKLMTWKRRHFRKLIPFLLVLITLVFVLKIQSLIYNLSRDEQVGENVELMWTMSKTAPLHPRADQDTAEARGQFAKFGISMIKLNHVTLQSSSDENGSDNKLLIDSHKILDMQPSMKDGTASDIKAAVRTVEPQNAGLFLAILVLSRPSNVLYRQAIRKTWGRDLGELGVVIRFLVGRDEHWDDIVDRELGMHADLIVIEEEDTYEYLPNKVLEGFVWALRQVPKPKFVMKVDDDTILNVPYLIHELNSNVLNSSQILGAVCVNSSVIRDPGDKWSVSLLDFPFSTYPPYVFGGAYVMSVTAASCIMQARAKTFDWLQLEDVYVTGLLAGRCGITPRPHPAFSHWGETKASDCDFVLSKRISSVNHTEQEFYHIYSGIQDLLRTRNVTRCGKMS